jgi:hypothetical protein
MRRDKAVLDDKGVLRRVPRGARVWIDNLPSQARPSASQQGHISNALGPEGFEPVVYHQARRDRRGRRRVPTAPYGLAGGVVELGRSPDGLARMLGRSLQSDPLASRSEFLTGGRSARHRKLDKWTLGGVPGVPKQAWAA